MSTWLANLLRDLRRRPRDLGFAALGVASGVAALCFFWALGRGAEHAVLDELLQAMPLNIVKVEPRLGLSFGPVRIGAGTALAPGLDETALRRLGQVPGVVQVHPMLPAAFPMRVSGGEALLGRRMYMDMFAVGVEPAFVAEDVDPRLFRDPGPDAKLIPVIASTQVLRIYNTTVSPAIGSPQLSRSAALGVEFTLILGESYATGRNSQRQELTARVVGLSPRVPLAGITVPMETLRRWNERLVGDKTPTYRAAFVETRSAREVDAVVAAADALGLRVDDSARLAGALIRGLTAVLSGVALLILLVAGMHIAQTFEAQAHARRREIALLRAFGASHVQLAGLFFGGALVIAILGGGLGVLVGVGAALAVQGVLAELLAQAPMLPARWILIDVWGVALPLAAALAAALLGTAAPAHRASRRDPVQVLSQR